jgi:hypothetical protein
MKCKFAKILVERHDQALFCLGALEDRVVRSARHVSPSPEHVMPRRPERFDRQSRKILVR